MMTSTKRPTTTDGYRVRLRAGDWFSVDLIVAGRNKFLLSESPVKGVYHMVREKDDLVTEQLPHTLVFLMDRHILVVKNIDQPAAEEHVVFYTQITFLS